MTARLGQHTADTSGYMCENCAPTHHRPNTSSASQAPSTGTSACCDRIRRTQSTCAQTSAESLAGTSACCDRIRRTQNTAWCWRHSSAETSVQPSTSACCVRIPRTPSTRACSRWAQRIRPQLPPGQATNPRRLVP
jgi:hypothetical protein